MIVVSEVLVSALLARLDEIEREHRAAADAELDEQERVGVRSRFGETLLANIADGIRLCRAHRDLIDEYEKNRQMAEQLGSDPAYEDGPTHLTAVGVTAGLRAAVVLVAGGLGVEETTDE